MRIAVAVKVCEGEINPFDACALEAALECENAEITVFSMGRENTKSVLAELTRLERVSAVLLCDNAFAGADTLATSYTLYKYLTHQPQPQQPPFDYVFCGRQSVDGDTAQVGPCLSKMLGIPLISRVMELTKIDRELAYCKTRDGNHIISAPALLTFERINTLRFPSVRSVKKSVKMLNAADIGADITRCGIAGSPTRVLQTIESVSGRRKCRYITKDEIFEVINRHKNAVLESKKAVKAEKRLQCVWTIGGVSDIMTAEIAEKVIRISSDTPEAIAALITEKKPKFVLWSADDYGRTTAPQVAAMLGCGLCADCTALETDGERLYMYRPAKSGSITAKIVCNSAVSMATVRSGSVCEGQVMLSLGLGCAGQQQQLCSFAKQNGYIIGGSRAAVDNGMIFYEQQIGLTGSNTSAAVYIAAGISGAVHHTCAIEGAGCVIAINPDKNARIFDYADYGIVDKIENVLR